MTTPATLRGQELLQLQQWLEKYSPETWPKLKEGKLRVKEYASFTILQTRFILVLHSLLSKRDLIRSYQQEFDIEQIKNIQDKMNMHHHWAINGKGQKDFGHYVEDFLTGALSDDQYNEARTWVERYAPDVMTAEMRTKEGFKIQNVRTKHSRQTNTDNTPVAPSTGGIRGPVDLSDRTHQIMSIAALLAEPLQEQEIIISSLDLLVSGTTVPQDRAAVESDAASLQILAEAILIDAQARGQGANRSGEVDVDMDSVNNDGNIQSTGSNAGAIGQWTPINGHVERMSQPWKETPAKPFVCEICNRSFTNRKYLQTHVREIHNTPAEPFICDICNRSYAVRRYLKSHIHRVHKSMPYECDNCRTIFSNEDHLL